MATPSSKIIQADRDNFKGVIIRPRHYEGLSKEDFKLQLSESLEAWKSEGRRGVWLSIPLMQSELISVAAEVGFKFHHSKPEMVTMTTWLSTLENTLPNYATHNIGVAGFVVNEKGEVLLVQEKWQRDINVIHWKLPGGCAEQGEDLWQTAIRETMEETGIRTEFIGFFCFRHMHAYKWGIDDLYFACLLRPTDTKLNPDFNEVAAVKWMNVEEYITDPATLGSNRWIAQSYQNAVRKGELIQPTLYPHFFPQKPPVSLYRPTECDPKQLCDLAIKNWSEEESTHMKDFTEKISKPKM